MCFSHFVDCGDSNLGIDAVMARRQSRRTDLTPQSMVTFNLPEQLDEAVEYHNQPKKPAYSLAPEVRGDLEHLLDVKISVAAWKKINETSARYVEHVQKYGTALSAVKVRTACSDIITVLDELIAIVNKHARGDPKMETFLSTHALTCDIRKLASLWKRMLERESLEQASVSEGTGWDQWVCELATIAPEIEITPSGEGPGGRSEQSSKFVELILRLQAELPEICAEHEGAPGSESSTASFARAVRRALKCGRV